MPMRAGDTVKHKPSGETWTVAYDDGTYLAWCGWPEGEAYTRDCELVQACTDEEHRKVLEGWAKVYLQGGRDGRDRRARVCFEQLCELNKVYVGAGI